MTLGLCVGAFALGWWLNGQRWKRLVDEHLEWLNGYAAEQRTAKAMMDTLRASIERTHS